MKHLTAIVLLVGAVLVAGCSVSMDGVSLSENKWVDNNCTGNGYVKNPAWCADGLHASMGPYAN